MKNIEVGDCSVCRVSGASNWLLLDPENLSVSVTFVIGSGCSERQYNLIDMRVGDLPADVDADSLAEWLREPEQQKQLSAIADCFVETRWTGNNHVGQWTGDAESLRDDFHWNLQDSLSGGGGGVRRCWDASEWLNGDPAATVSAALKAEDLDAAAQNEVEGALDEGVVLNSDDTRTALKAILDNAIDEWADTDQDQTRARKLGELVDREVAFR